MVGQCKAGKEKDENNVFDRIIQEQEWLVNARLKGKGLNFFFYRIIQEPDWLVLTLKSKARKEKEKKTLKLNPARASNLK